MKSLSSIIPTRLLGLAAQEPTTYRFGNEAGSSAVVSLSYASLRLEPP